MASVSEVSPPGAPVVSIVEPAFEILPPSELEDTPVPGVLLPEVWASLDCIGVASVLVASPPGVTAVLIVEPESEMLLLLGFEDTPVPGVLSLEVCVSPVCTGVASVLVASPPGVPAVLVTVEPALEILPSPELEEASVPGVLLPEVCASLDCAGVASVPVVSPPEVTAVSVTVEPASEMLPLLRVEEATISVVFSPVCVSAVPVVSPPGVTAVLRIVEPASEMFPSSGVEELAVPVLFSPEVSASPVCVGAVSVPVRVSPPGVTAVLVIAELVSETSPLAGVDESVPAVLSLLVSVSPVCMLVVPVPVRVSLPGVTVVSITVEPASEISPPLGVEAPGPELSVSVPLLSVVPWPGVCVLLVCVGVAFVAVRVSPPGVTSVLMMVDPEPEMSPPGVDAPVRGLPVSVPLLSIVPWPPVCVVVWIGAAFVSVAVSPPGVTAVSMTVEPASEMAPPGVEVSVTGLSVPVSLISVVSWPGPCVLLVCESVGMLPPVGVAGLVVSEELSTTLPWVVELLSALSILLLPALVVLCPGVCVFSVLVFVRVVC